MEPNKKNSSMIWGVVIVVAIIIIGAVWMNKKNDTVVVEDTVVTDTTEGTEDTTPVSGTTGSTTGAASISYQQALVKYKDARLQLGANQQCGPVTPTSMSVKNGSTIMVDNRSAMTRNVKIGTTYSIKPYGFRLVTLNSSILPSTWLVDCGSQQNVATITIQK